ncbi:hypothetical protein [Antarctobacter sp.]|uniref:hypothetical protein n=1 Tax=Antarctobacter sp. TaxID=1872577 RepID=UPI002B2682C7|nr:hypothetical protein [Antarctobacter sp.]
MPDGNSRDWVTHPGPEQPERYALIPCHARRALLHLKAGMTLLNAIGAEVGAAGADGACAILDGVGFSDMHYVMPDGPADDAHAAWYSETHIAKDITLDRATASVGLRDGAWFLHTHAIWGGDTPAMGHLLNDLCVLARDCTVEVWLLTGARLEVTLDPETKFPLFQPHPCTVQALPNAALLTVRPHEDLHTALESACAEAGLPDVQVHGLGSLIGARFTGAPPMSSTLSEVLLLAGCLVRDGRCLDLPLVCVDPSGQIYQGNLVPTKGPVLVTFEMLLVSHRTG